MDNTDNEFLCPFVVSKLTPREERILEYYKEGKKRKDICLLENCTRFQVSNARRHAERKQQMFDAIRSQGETWIGDIPGIPSHSVGALQRNGIYTVSELLAVDDNTLKEMWGIGSKGIDAILKFMEKRSLQ